MQRFDVLRKMSAMGEKIFQKFPILNFFFCIWIKWPPFKKSINFDFWVFSYIKI